MMRKRIVVTDSDDAIVGIGTIVDESDYFKNPRLTLDDGSKVSFVFTVNIYECVDVPDDASVFDCYSPDKGFYKAPTKEAPDQNIYGISNEIYCAIKNEVVEEIKQEVTRNVN